MHFTRLLSFSTIIAGLTIVPLWQQAMAADSGETYLLQLGSFEKQEDAQARWQSLQAKYPDLLGELSLRVMDVTLPPDNFTVYRTQGGPVESRAKAELLCEKLGSKGDECYVVETAMFAPGADQSSLPNPPLMVDRSTAESQLSKGQPVVDQAAPPAAPSAEVAPATAPVPASEAVATPAASPAPLLSAPPSDALTETPDASAEPFMEPLLEPFPAEEVAAKEEENKDGKKDGSFWSFLDPINPFTGDEKANTTGAAKDNIELEPVVAPSVPVPQMEPLPEPVAPPPPAMPEPVAPQPVAPAPAPAPQSNNGTVPWQSPAVPATASPFMSLPTPPAPPADEQFRTASQSRLNRPFGSATRTMPFPSSPANPVPVQANDHAEVTVAEAVRVPLSSQSGQLFAYPSGTGEVQATPSQQLPRSRSLWAQIGYFVDQQTALAYWQDFRTKHPNLPALRVRVTSPYAIASSAPRVSLRVGPFEQPYHVTNFCNDVSTDDFQCRPLAEFGESSSRRGDGNLSSRYENRMARENLSRTDMYWIQMGTYASAGEAQNQWSEMASRYKTLLKGKTPNITPPAQGSGAQATYRLRTGPFPLRYDASSLCTALKAQGAGCIVVFGR